MAHWICDGCKQPQSPDETPFMGMHGWQCNSCQSKQRNYLRGPRTRDSETDGTRPFRLMLARFIASHNT